MTEKTVDMSSDPEFDDYRYANYRYLLFNDLCEDSIKIEQNFTLGKGGILWDASYAMSKYLSSLYLQNKKILEIGAGTALPSVLCGIKGAEVYATDINPALSLTIGNTNQNSSLFKGSVLVRELNWTSPSHWQNIENNAFDYILLSDVFYLPVFFS